MQRSHRAMVYVPFSIMPVRSHFIPRQVGQTNAKPSQSEQLGRPAPWQRAHLARQSSGSVRAENLSDNGVKLGGVGVTFSVRAEAVRASRSGCGRRVRLVWSLSLSM